MLQRGQPDNDEEDGKNPKHQKQDKKESTKIKNSMGLERYGFQSTKQSKLSANDTNPAVITDEKKNGNKSGWKEDEDQLDDQLRKIQLDEEKSENFHSVVAKLLYIMKSTRSDLDTAVGFLITRVSKSDEDVWTKLRILSGQ